MLAEISDDDFTVADFVPKYSYLILELNMEFRRVLDELTQSQIRLKQLQSVKLGQDQGQPKISIRLINCTMLPCSFLACNTSTVRSNNLSSPDKGCGSSISHSYRLRKRAP